MKSSLFLIIVICLALTLFSCSKQKGQNKNSIELNFTSTFELRDDVRNAIVKYTNKYPQFNSFILTYLIDKNRSNEFLLSELNNFIIGPAYENAMPELIPLMYFDLNGKKVFIKSGIERLFINHDSIFLKQQIKRGSDSIIISPDWIVKNGDVLYLYKAMCFSIDNENNISTNYRPDTILIPKNLNSTISFDPNKKY